MSFVQPRRSASRMSAGIGVAIVFHIALVWALMNGLAHKLVQAIAEPIETRIVEEIKPPPPPKKVIELPPPPAFTPPPPVFVPPPEVQIQSAAPTTTISHTTALPVTSTRVEAPAQPSAPAKPAAPPAKLNAAVACSNYNAVMGQASFPRAASRLGLEEGDALIQFTLAANGEVKDVKAIRASHALFAENSIRLVSAYKCAGRGADVLVQVPFAYKIE
jgi:protein TonB